MTTLNNLSAQRPVQNLLRFHQLANQNYDWDNRFFRIRVQTRRSNTERCEFNQRLSDRDANCAQRPFVQIEDPIRYGAHGVIMSYNEKSLTVLFGQLPEKSQNFSGGFRVKVSRRLIR